MGILDGRVAIVTGASSGIGRACAIRFAEEGAAVVGCARRTELLDELIDEIAAKGGKAVAVRCDVTNEDDITNVVETAASQFGRVDILGNFAQAFYPYRVIDHANLMATTAENAINQFRGGPVQYLLFMQKCFPYMKEQRYGRIINTSSGAWLLGAPDFVGYGMAKAATDALTRHASQDWGQYGIVTNTIYPIVRNEDHEKEHPEMAESLPKRIPVRYHGTAYDDLSPVVAFLASEAAGYVNGQSLGINGGLFFV
jgi:NAD(P)-dependent dehydrogenase (short-subunit alcohol dehydrogenase family)